MNTKSFLPLMFLSLFSLFLFSCDKDDMPDNHTDAVFALLDVSADGVTRALTDNICPVLQATSPLTADEIEFLYALREDEKLSRDVCLFFASLYPDYPWFSRIASAEATHIKAAETMLTYYEIEFPAIGEPGIFSDPERQARYQELTSRENTVTEALAAVAFLEEENIAAYQNVAAGIENPNIKIFVENLLKSSSNHLKAAVRQITSAGGAYTPSVLSQQEYDTIIASEFTQGNQLRKQNGKNGQGGNCNSEKNGAGKGRKGSVDKNGTCTGTVSGSYPGTCDGSGKAGKGYRGGRS